MKFFIDSANLDEIRKVAEMGLVDGVTTNPSLLAKEGKGFKTTIQEICSIVDGPVSAEVVTSDNAEEMLKEAHIVSSWHPNVVVKIPFGPEGMKVVKKLSAEGIRTNVTVLFTVTQALIAAKAGATFLSNFVGRVDDISGEGMVAVRDTVDMVDVYDFKSEVLVASVRSPQHIVEAVRAGAHIATIPFKVLEMMYKHPLTTSGIATFTEDWKKSGLSFD
ncbi:MAG: fructose-6-phosphate aldolase [Capsulimonadales bacterium]|nr:fructose-6-phosphate aldolase [Capsulimonadales bacterium]